MFGIRVGPVDEIGYRAVSKGVGYTTRKVMCDGEFRLYHKGGMESLLHIEDEVIVDQHGRLLGAKISPGSYYLAV